MDYFFYCYRERKDIYDYYFVEVLCLIYEEAEYQYKSISIYNNDYITNNGYDGDIDQENLVIDSICTHNIAGIIQESCNDIDIYSEKIKEYEKQFDISKLIPYEYSEDVDPSELKLEQVLLDVQNIERRKEEALGQGLLDFVQVMRSYIKVEWKNISKKEFYKKRLSRKLVYRIRKEWLEIFGTIIDYLPCC